jgi:hypothetical protein
MPQKKTGKSNFGPEFAKKAYEAKLSERVPYDPDWDGKPMRQKETWDNTKVKKVKPGKTVIGPLSKGLSSGGVAGLALGAIAAYKAEIKATSKAKQKKNRMN